MAKEPEAVVVLGPHRSGTSMIAGLLKILGVYLGPDHELMTPHPENEKGYFEHSEICLINMLLLQSFGGDWWNPPSLPPGWERSSQIDGLRQQANALLRRVFENQLLWGFKDPRCCFTFRFWQSLIQVPIRVILVFRNPYDVALSLKTRSGMPIYQGVDLWFRHIKEGFRVSRGLKRHLVLYEDFLENFDLELKRLAFFLGKDITPEIEKKAREFSSSELRHHRSTPQQLNAQMEISPLIRDLHYALVTLSKSVKKGEADLSVVDDSFIGHTL